MSIPLRAKVAIRDIWSKDDGPNQAAMASVQKNLGVDTTCEPDWALLIAELGELHADKFSLVATVASLVQVWFNAIDQLLDGENSEEWSDTLLEKLKAVNSRLQLSVDVHDGINPFTQWEDRRRGFVVYLPKQEMRDAREFLGKFTEEIQSAFDKPDKADEPGSDQPDGWAEIDGSTMNVVAGASPTVEDPSASPTTKSVSQYLPRLETLARPDELLSRPPYHLQVLTLGASFLEVRCSHSPTLEVLHSYLKKWCRTDSTRTDRPPLLNIKLHHSSFGLGVTYDRLTLSTEGRRGEPITIPPTMILHIVEGHFGYEKVYEDSSNWHYRRDIAFKR